jgi:cell division protein FtsQ
MPPDRTDDAAVRTDVAAPPAAMAPPATPLVIPEAEPGAVDQAEVEVEAKVEGHEGAPEAPVERQGQALDSAPPKETSARPEHAADPARRRRMMPWAIASCALVAIGAIAIGLSYTPLVAARTLSVRGERHLTEGQILRIARLGEGTNLVHADLAAAEARLERNPWVADATVERDLPHTLRISVTERTPLAVTARPNGALAFVATDGTLMGSAAEGSPLPTIVATDGELPAPAEVLRTGAAVVDAMPVALQRRTGSISVGPDGSVAVETLTHIVVTYGDGSQLEAKGQTLKAVLDWSEREGVALAAVDVTVPGAPTARRYGAPVDSQITLSSRLR